MSKPQPIEGGARRCTSLRMRIGTFVVRCGLRIAYGSRDNYAAVTMTLGTSPEVTQ